MLGPGDTAPDFELPCATKGRASTIRLRDLRTDLVVVFFYPRDFSFICPTEVTGFNQFLRTFEEAKCSVLGIRGDSVESHLKWSEELGGLDYPLLSDADGRVARGYGIYDEKEKVPIRATFVIGKDRIVVHATACPLNVGRSVSDTLRIVQAIGTGQMCPADWKPGMELGPSDRKF